MLDPLLWSSQRLQALECILGARIVLPVAFERGPCARQVIFDRHDQFVVTLDFLH